MDNNIFNEIVIDEECVQDIIRCRIGELAAIRVIVREPTVIVLWNDGTKTVVTCSKNDTFNIYSGIMAAFLKKIMTAKMFHAKVERAMKKVVYQEQSKKTKQVKKPTKSKKKA